MPPPLRAGWAGLILALTVGCTAPPAAPAQTSPPASPVITESPSPAPSMSPSPTPSAPETAEDRAAAAASKTYTDYLRALDRLFQSGGANKLPAYVAKYLHPDSTTRWTDQDEARAVKAHGDRWEGATVITNVWASPQIRLDDDVPETYVNACVDRTNVSYVDGDGDRTQLRLNVHRVLMYLDKSTNHWQVAGVEELAAAPDSCL